MKMQRMLARLMNQRGFTLIEIMVVVVILGILAGLVVPRLLDRPEEARRTQAAVQIKSLEESLALYKLDNGVFPTTEQGLEALVTKPSIAPEPRKYPKNGYIKTIPQDPWGSDYVYYSPGEHGDFDLSSYGADKAEGGEDEDADINNWQVE